MRKEQLEKLQECLQSIQQTIEKGRAMNLDSKKDWLTPIYSGLNNKPKFLRVVFSRRSNEVIFHPYCSNEKSE